MNDTKLFLKDLCELLIVMAQATGLLIVTITLLLILSTSVAVLQGGV